MYEGKNDFPISNINRYTGANPMKKIILFILFGFVSVGMIYSAFIKVESPNGGEKWRLKQVRYISWQSKGVSRNLKITLWKDERLLGVIANNVSPDTDIHRWPVGQYGDKQALPGIGYKIKIKEKGIPVSDMSNHSFEILKEEEETDLSLSNCVIKERSGKQVNVLRKGDICKIEFLVRVPADQPCFKFNMEVWSIHGQLSSSKFALRGKTTFKKLFIFTPPWTEKMGYFYLTFNEEKTGPFTLILKVSAVVPKIDTNANNNKCQIPFEMVVDREWRKDIRIKKESYQQIEIRPNLKVSFHNIAPNQDSFNVLIENEKYKTAKFKKEFLVYVKFNTKRNLGRGWVDFETRTVSEKFINSLNNIGKFYMGFFSRGWIDAGATTCTVTVDARDDITESNENDNQCVINF